MKLLLALCLLLPTLPAASLTLIPNSGNINIEPGTTYGWGFELNNNTSNYMLVTSLVASGFDPLMGTFQDFIVSVNPTILGPNTILNQAYNQALQQGFGEFAMLPGALIGSTTGATFSVTYDLLVNDPFGPLGSHPNDQYSLEFTFDGSVTATDPTPVSGVPEPSSVVLTGAGLLCAAWRLRRANSVRC